MSNSVKEKMNYLYLSFSLGERRFLTDLSLVREVRQMRGFTEVPQSAPELLGIVNLRGDVIPVFDLHKVLEATEPCRTVDSALCLIVEVEQRVCALVVESVADVINLEHEKILPIPSVNMNHSAGFYKGIVHLDSQYTIVLDLPAIMHLLQPDEQLTNSP